MTDWTDKRNRHVKILRVLLVRERRWQVEDNDEDRAEGVAALEFAVERLTGVPEHWAAVESGPDDPPPRY